MVATVLRLLAAAALAAVARAKAPTEPGEMRAEAERLMALAGSVDMAVQVALNDHLSPDAIQKCTKIADDLEAFCTGVTDATCGSDLDGVSGCCEGDPAFDQTKADKAEICCESDCDGPPPCTRKRREDLGDASGDARRRVAGTEDDACPACKLDRTSKEFQATCTVEGIQGPSVCGADAGGQALPVPDVYFRGGGECSTGPEHELDGTDDEDGVKTCRVRVGDFEALQEAFDQAPATAGALVRPPMDEGSAAERAFEAVSEFMFAYVINAPAAVNKARIKVNVRADSAGNQCTGVLPHPHFAGELDLEAANDVMVLNPTSTVDADIEVKGNSSASIIGGTNAGLVHSVTTGKLRVVDLDNSGQVKIEGGTDVFIAGVRNSGEVDVINTDASVFNTSNAGKLVVNGGTFHMERVINEAGGEVTILAGTGHVHLICNRGTVTVAEGVTGTIKAPPGSNLQLPAGATLVEEGVEECSTATPADPGPDDRPLLPESPEDPDDPSPTTPAAEGDAPAVVTAAPQNAAVAPDSSDIDFIAAGGAVLDEITAAMTTIQGKCVADLQNATANGADAAEKKCEDAFSAGVPGQVGASCVEPAEASSCVDGESCPACSTDACHTAIRAATDAEIQKLASACSDFNAAFSELIPVFQDCITKALLGISDVAIRAQLKGDFEVPAAPDQPTTPEQLRFELFKLANECSLAGLSLTPPNKAEREQQTKQAAQKVATAKLAVAKEEQKLDPTIKTAIQGKTGQAAIDAAKQAAANDPNLTEAEAEAQVKEVQAKQAAVTTAEASQAAAAKTSNSAAAAEQPSSGASAVTATAAAAAVSAAGLALLW